ncbi:unnamed protein product, partial [marine sediment metagenome]
MALVEYGGGIVRVSGSIAGNTFSKSQGFHNIRSKTKPVDKNTARQQLIRATFTYLANRWAQTLTDQQRLDWADYGKNVTLKNRIDEDQHVSGFHHYMRSNVPRIQSGIAPVDNGPAINLIPASDPKRTVRTASHLLLKFEHMQIDFDFL